jgi:hypothetical protein
MASYDNEASEIDINNTIDDFDSPYIDTDVKRGGNVKFGELGVLKWVIIGIMVCLIIYLIFAIFKQIRFNGEDYTQRQTRNHFERLHGDTNDEEAKQTIQAGLAIPNPRAIDHYRIGTTFLINAHDPAQAHRHFARAIDQIMGDAVDHREAEFILDRIDDFENNFMELNDLTDLPIQQALFHVF